IHVAFDLAAAHGIRELLGGLGDDLVPVIVEPIDQRTDRRVFLVLYQCRVIIGPQEIAAFLKGLEQLSIIDVEAEALGSRVEICSVYEKGNLLSWVKHFFHPVFFITCWAGLASAVKPELVVQELQYITDQ